MHRDITPANLLLDETLRKLKIIDFGLSGQYQRDESVSRQADHTHYTAPEMTFQLTDSAEEKCRAVRNKFLFACDVFSWAYVCSYTLTGHEGKVSLSKTLPTVLTEKSVGNAPLSTFEDLLNATSDVEAEKRPTANTCIETLKSWQQKHFPSLCFCLSTHFIFAILQSRRQSSAR